MTWKKGKVKFDDGTVYTADLLLKDNGEVWNMKVHTESGVIEEIDTQSFAMKLKKDVKSIYPFTYELEE